MTSVDICLICSSYVCILLSSLAKTHNRPKIIPIPDSFLYFISLCGSAHQFDGLCWPIFTTPESYSPHQSITTFIFKFPPNHSVANFTYRQMANTVSYKHMPKKYGKTSTFKPRINTTTLCHYSECPKSRSPCDRPPQ